jgi:hypothetical protein
LSLDTAEEADAWLTDVRRHHTRYVADVFT